MLSGVQNTLASPISLWFVEKGRIYLEIYRSFSERVFWSAIEPRWPVEVQKELLAWKRQAYLKWKYLVFNKIRIGCSVTCKWRFRSFPLNFAACKRRKSICSYFVYNKNKLVFLAKHLLKLGNWGHSINHLIFMSCASHHATRDGKTFFFPVCGYQSL